MVIAQGQNKGETNQRLERLAWTIGDEALIFPLSPAAEQVGILALSGEPGGAYQPRRIPWCMEAIKEDLNQGKELQPAALCPKHSHYFFSH